MTSPIDSSKLAKQIAERLKMNPEKELELYNELSQISNGAVKKALEALSVKKYVACINENCVRDAQCATKFCDDPEDDSIWVDAFRPLFLKVIEAEREEDAKRIAAEYAGVEEDVIDIYTI